MNNFDRRDNIVAQLTASGITTEIDWRRVPQMNIYPVVVVTAPKTVPVTAANVVVKQQHKIFITCLVDAESIDLQDAEQAAKTLVLSVLTSLQGIRVSFDVNSESYSLGSNGTHTVYGGELEITVYDTAN